MKGLIPRNSGIFYALITACGLGSITTQAKIFYADGGNALTLMLTRFLVSSLVFGLLILIRRETFTVLRKQRQAILLLGLIWSGSMISYLLSVERISVSLAVLLLYFYPLIVLAYAFLKRQLKPSTALIGLFLGAFIGLFFALSGGAETVNLTGILLAGLASGGAAFTFICGARVASAMSPLLMTFWVNAIGLLIILPLMIDAVALPQTDAGLMALALVTVFYLIAILSQFQALARLPAAKAAFLLNLEPVVSILLAHLVLHEVLSFAQTAGVIIVISMIILSLRFRPSDA